MKKSILAVAVLLGTSAFAQKKDADAYLPHAEDWAIGVDATPFLNYFGNLIGGGQNANNAPTWNYLTTNQTITGKYFVDDNTAYRASVRLGFGSNKGENQVVDRSYTGTVEYPSSMAPMVANTWKMGTTNIGIGVGLEKRRGHGRLVGMYGAEFGISLSSSKNTYTYGNALNQNATGNVNVDAVDDAMGGGGNISTDPFGNTSRVLESKSGMGMAIGLRGFIGAEYFILPHIAVGGEFGWGLAMVSGGKATSSMESEGFNAVPTEVTSTFDTETKNNSSFGIDTDALNSVFGPAGTLRMTFYF
jgi:hypothetical protein